ncbi:MAG: hypothetical protein AB1467_04795 [Candidatus Diapherotrites archaeon]
MNYNKAFFGLYENLFLVLKKEFRVKKALKIFEKIITFGLKKTYDQSGFRKGNLSDFVRVVKARDNSVGLKVSVKVHSNKIIYRFFTDPFPGLKGKVSAEKLDATYMKFKVNYLLGPKWKYETTKHLWVKDHFTEHKIYLTYT